MKKMYVFILLSTTLLTHSLYLQSTSLEIQRVFSGIYHEGFWLDDARESYSGIGSRICATQIIRATLPKIIQAYNISTLLDIPCGDFNWMKVIDLGSTKYIGADIVPDIVRKNEKLYAGNNRTFLQLDITSDHLPKADLILCRDCLAHLSFKHIVEAIKNCKRSGAKYLLASNFAGSMNNTDICDGDFRPLNVLLAPFNFPQPIFSIDEESPGGPDKIFRKHMCLWALDQIDIENE